MVFSFIPLSIAAGCPLTMTEVDASASPATDENQNGLICEYMRAMEGYPTVMYYQDDMS